LQQQNNFESLTVEEKIVNIKNRIAELKMRLNHKSGNVNLIKALYPPKNL